MDTQSHKILFLITQSEFGGAQKNILEFAKHLSSKHMVIVTAGEGDGEFFQKCAEAGITTHAFQHLKREILPFQDMLAYFEITAYIQETKPDLLVLASSKAAFIGSIIAKKLNIHCAHYVGGWAFNEDIHPLKKYSYFLAEKFTAPYKMNIITNCEHDYKQAIERKIAPENRLSIVYNGLDLENQRFYPKEEAREKLKIPIGDKKIVGTIANFYPTKGLLYLLGATKTLRNDDNSSTVVIIGDGIQRREIEHFITQHQLQEKVILAGRKKNASEYLSAFDIFVLPSVKEGMPWVILEAMAARLPIIATRVGGIPEMIIHGKSGILVPPKDPLALRESINLLLRDEQYAQHLAANAQERVKRFHKDAMNAAFEQAISSIL